MFDPDKYLKFSYEIGLARLMGVKYETDHVMGKVACSHLREIFLAWFVGRNEEYSCLLPRSLNWIDRGLKRGELAGETQKFYHSEYNWAKALILWAVDNINVANVWGEAKQLLSEQQKIKLSFPKSQMGSQYLNDYMALCFQSQDYEEGIAVFQSYHGEKKISLRSSLYPRDYAYVLCLNKARGDFDGEDFLAIGRRMLKTNLNKNWLTVGQAIRAVTWLKIVYWHHVPGITPVETVLRGYDDMPDVVKPDFLN